MFESMTGSLLIVLIIGGILAGFAMVVTALLTWIVGADPDVPYTQTMREPTETKPPLRKAA